jgi:hypothetical protein
MTDDALRAQLAAELALIESVVRDLGYDTTLDDQADPPMLGVDLGDDDQRVMVITIRSDGLFADTEDVHLNVVLPFTVPPDRTDDVEHAITIVNRVVDTGRFELAGTAVALEHAVTVDASATIDDGLVRELVTTLADEQQRFGDYLHGVVDGEIAVAVLADVIAADS